MIRTGFLWAMLGCMLAMGAVCEAGDEIAPGVRVDNLFNEAEAAADTAQRERALSLLDELLKLAPKHRGAAALRKEVAAFTGDPKAARPWLLRANALLNQPMPKGHDRSDWEWQMRQVALLQARAGDADGGEAIPGVRGKEPEGQIAMEQIYIGDLTGAAATIALMSDSTSRCMALGALAMGQADGADFTKAWASASSIGSMKNTYDQGLKTRVCEHIARQQIRAGDAATAMKRLMAIELPTERLILPETDARPDPRGFAGQGRFPEAIAAAADIKGQDREILMRHLTGICGELGDDVSLRWLIANERTPQASEALAEILSDRGDMPGAIAAAAVVNDSDNWRRIGEICLAAGDKAGATAMFQRAVAAAKAAPVERTFRVFQLAAAGEAQKRAGDLAGSKASFAAAESFVTHTADRSTLGQYQAKAGMINEAKASLQQARFGEEELRHELASAQFASGDVDGALQTASEMGRPSTWFDTLGVLLAQSGKIDAAESAAPKIHNLLDRAALFTGVARGLLSRCGRNGFTWRRELRQSE